MEGTIEVDNKSYWWWAGPANQGAKEDFCVHCRNETFGVTQYIGTKPDQAFGERMARALVPKVIAAS